LPLTLAVSAIVATVDSGDAQSIEKFYRGWATGPMTADLQIFWPGVHPSDSGTATVF
jgi:hypothetical protein